MIESFVNVVFCIWQKDENEEQQQQQQEQQQNFLHTSQFGPLFLPPVIGLFSSSILRSFFPHSPICSMTQGKTGKKGVRRENQSKWNSHASSDMFVAARGDSGSEGDDGAFSKEND